MPIKPTRGPVTIVILVIACSAGLAACGSANKTAGTKVRGDGLIAFSKCMRAHGVTNFPDPSSTGLNLNGTGINPQSPAFRTAQTTCSKLLPGGGPANQHASARQIKRATESAECMRAHGVAGFPDPTISTSGPPDLNPANYSSIEDDGGIIFAIPNSINESSPTFMAAAKICHFNG